MNAEVLVWASALKWVFGLLLVALVVLTVDVIKRAVAGKGEPLHWGRIFYRAHLKKGS